MKFYDDDNEEDEFTEEEISLKDSVKPATKGFPRHIMRMSMTLSSPT